ncbi:MAG TPA: hypothetical protein VHZ73_06145 [Vicinamibacterales bacterium]|jgi:hypothetical protein|nr:hypothetical protein [Vicinamibacterales bacterium]
MGWPRPLRSRFARLAGISIAAVVLLAGAAYALLPLAIEALTATIDLTLNAGVSLATLVGGGADLSTILIAIGREVFRALASPRVLGVIAALVLLSAGALYGLQRVLALEEESNAN